MSYEYNYCPFHFWCYYKHNQCFFNIWITKQYKYGIFNFWCLVYYNHHLAICLFLANQHVIHLNQQIALPQLPILLLLIKLLQVHHHCFLTKNLYLANRLQVHPIHVSEYQILDLHPCLVVWVLLIKNHRVLIKYLCLEELQPLNQQLQHLDKTHCLLLWIWSTHIKQVQGATFGGTSFSSWR